MRMMMNRGDYTMIFVPIIVMSLMASSIYACEPRELDQAHAELVSLLSQFPVECKELFAAGGDDRACHSVLDQWIDDAKVAVGSDSAPSTVIADPAPVEELPVSEILEARFGCRMCGASFVTHALAMEHRLQTRHRLLQGSERPFVCAVCTSTFVTYIGLKRHQLTHKTRACKCPECKKLFARSDYLQEHVRNIHHATQLFICDYPGCDQAFASAWQLKQHRNIIHNGVRHWCSYCRKLFSTAVTLRRHMCSAHRERTSHREENRISVVDVPVAAPCAELRFGCKTCGNCFVTHALQLAHQRETGHNLVQGPANPFECMVCGATFARYCLLASHKHVHETPGEFTCTVCGAVLSRQRGLYEHMKRAHTHA